METEPKCTVLPPAGRAEMMRAAGLSPKHHRFVGRIYGDKPIEKPKPRRKPQSIAMRRYIEDKRLNERALLKPDMTAEELELWNRERLRSATQSRKSTRKGKDTTWLSRRTKAKLS